MPSINLSTGQTHGLVFVKSLRTFGQIRTTVYRGFSGVTMLTERHIRLDDGTEIATYDDDLACPDNVAVMRLPRRALLRMLDVDDVLAPCDCEPDGPEVA